MSRRSGPARARAPYAPPPSNCAKFLYYTWKLCSVVFSHFVMISMVVAYCILGAVTFERLEAQHEREVKRNISQIRGNTTHSIWLMTNRASYLSQANWTADVLDMLKDFENAILLEMKVRGWDGDESADRIQWTFTGALFYSIIVITTIGYGHIAPKTQSGKVVTIFYAILGIPLMLLCLSNIGDVMASSFRFLYWRVCCYVCTRPPKERPRSRSRRPTRGSTRRPPVLERSHSDTDCRYRDGGYAPARSPRAAHPPPRRPPDEDDEFPRISLPLRDLRGALKDLDDYQRTTRAADPRGESPRPYGMHDLRDVDYQNYRERRALEDRRRAEVGGDDDRTLGGSDRRGGRRGRSEYRERDPDEFPGSGRRGPRARSAFYEYERHEARRADVERGRPRRSRTLDHGYHSPSPGRDEWSDEGPPIRRVDSSVWGSRRSLAYAASGKREQVKPVPIWLCVCLVASYIVAGTFLFKRWEGWAYLDAAYFCFITLTTIGFGDFVPAQGQSGSAAGAGAAAAAGADAVHSIALCSLYLLFGIALLAMSFNLVQEEVRANVAALATKLGIIKPRDAD